VAAALVVMVALAATAVAGCGTPPRASAPPTAAPPHAPYHLDASVERHCSWVNQGPATCQVYITNQTDSNFTFEWRATSTPLGATFAPASGSLAPGETSELITVTSPTVICPITFRFVDAQRQLEADSVFNAPCTGG
jgi:hypothetical protein